MRSALVAALVSSADSSHRFRARRFVEGLSSDELQFIAGFLGACVLDPSTGPCASREQWAEQIARYREFSGGQPCRSADEEHKMILLLEYLRWCKSSAPNLPTTCRGPVSDDRLSPNL